MVGPVAACNGGCNRHGNEIAGKREDQGSPGIDLQNLREPGYETALANFIATRVEDTRIEFGLQEEMEVRLKTGGPVLEVPDVLHLCLLLHKQHVMDHDTSSRLLPKN